MTDNQPEESRRGVEGRVLEAAGATAGRLDSAGPVIRGVDFRLGEETAWAVRGGDAVARGGPVDEARAGGVRDGATAAVRAREDERDIDGVGVDVFLAVVDFPPGGVTVAFAVVVRRAGDGEAGFAAEGDDVLWARTGLSPDGRGRSPSGSAGRTDDGRGDRAGAGAGRGTGAAAS
jgi:hypothetical protein